MISFVIPAYNASKTISRALNSILEQKETNLDYEIVLVNDGSNDDTENIVNQWLQEKQENEKSKDCVALKKTILNSEGRKVQFVYLKKANGGLADARNVGIDNSTGDYIIFVDSDDYISNYLLHDIEKYINEGIELIKWNPIYVNEKGEQVGIEPCYPFEKRTGIEGFYALYGKDKLISSAWNYAVSRNIVMKFPKGRYHEDFATMPLVVLQAKSMVSLGKNEYYYVLSNESIMRTSDAKKKRKKLEDILSNFDELVKRAQQLKLDKYTFENFMIFLTNSLLVILPELEGEDKHFFKEQLKKRHISKNIKIRNIKQFIKKVMLQAKGL